MNVKQKICALSGHPQHKSQLLLAALKLRVSRHFNSRDYVHCSRKVEN